MFVPQKIGVVWIRWPRSEAMQSTAG